MSIKRAIIIPVLLAFGVAGSAVAGSAMPLAATHAPAAHVVAAADGGPSVVYIW
jgi:hypothetical protein